MRARVGTCLLAFSGGRRGVVALSPGHGDELELDADAIEPACPRVEISAACDPERHVVQARATLIEGLARVAARGMAQPSNPAPVGCRRFPAGALASQASPITGYCPAQPQRCDIVTVRYATM
jgi:hypothetical protein